ncbi:MAG: hypothetical protein ACREKL_04080 [Chthoniobacterales bacterium]
MTRSALFLAIALGLSLAACQDTRRDAVRKFLETHPPENFALAGIPDNITVARGSSGGDESVLQVKYRLIHPTVELHDALMDPRGVEVSRRIAAVRGWALSSLPASDPMRSEITAASAKARAPIPVKRVVTPAGTVIETLAILKLTKTAADWQVTPESLDAHVPGQFDTNRDIPLEHSPEATSKLDSLTTLAKHLEDTQKNYVESRRRAAGRSLVTLRSLMRTGNTFEGSLPSGASTRFVVTRGIEAGDPGIVVLTVQRGMQSSARYTGGVAREPSGEYIWRAAQVTTLSGRGDESATNATLHPILTLTAAPDGLTAHIKAGAAPAFSLKLSRTENADLIPETPAQDAGQ